MTGRVSQNGGDSIDERPDIQEEDEEDTAEGAHHSRANLPRQKPTLRLITKN